MRTFSAFRLRPRRFALVSLAVVVGSATLMAGCGGIVGPYPESDTDDAGAGGSGGGGTTIGLPSSGGLGAADAGAGVGTSLDAGGFGGFGDDGGPVTSGDDDSGTVVITGDDDDDGGLVTGDDAGSDGGTIADAGEGSGAPVLGSVSFNVPGFSNKGNSPGTIRAAFFTEVVTAPASPCAQTNPSPACVLTVCDAGQSSPTTVQTASTQEAGDITVVESNFTNVLKYAKGAYSAAFYSNEPYSDAITIAAPGFGGAVPAFSFAFPEPGATTPTAPVETVVPMQHPSLNPIEYETSFPRSSDLAVTWTGGVATTNVVITLYAHSTAVGSPTETLACTFDQGSGSGVVPSFAGLSQLPLVDGTTVLGTLSYDWTVSRTTTAGNATITASLDGRRGVNVRFTTTN